MFANGNVVQNRALQFAISVACFFAVLLSWNSLGATGNQIPKLPSFNWEQIEKEATPLNDHCSFAELDADRMPCSVPPKQNPNKRLGDFFEKTSIGNVRSRPADVTQPKT